MIYLLLSVQRHRRTGILRRTYQESLYARFAFELVGKPACPSGSGRRFQGCNEIFRRQASGALQAKATIQRRCLRRHLSGLHAVAAVGQEAAKGQQALRRQVLSLWFNRSSGGASPALPHTFSRVDGGPGIALLRLPCKRARGRQAWRARPDDERVSVARSLAPESADMVVVCASAISTTILGASLHRKPAREVI